MVVQPSPNGTLAWGGGKVDGGEKEMLQHGSAQDGLE